MPLSLMIHRQPQHPVLHHNRVSARILYLSFHSLTYSNNTVFVLLCLRNTVFSTQNCGLIDVTPFRTNCSSRVCCFSNQGELDCIPNGNSCGAGPSSNDACVAADVGGCNLSTQYCCKPSAQSNAQLTCTPYGDECGTTGYTAILNPDGVNIDVKAYSPPTAAAVASVEAPFDFESAAATKTDSNDMMSINGLGLSPTYYPTYYPTYTEDGNANNVALSQSQMMSNLDESSAIRSVGIGSYFASSLVVIILGLYVYVL